MRMNVPETMERLNNCKQKFFQCKKNYFHILCVRCVVKRCKEQVQATNTHSNETKKIQSFVLGSFKEECRFLVVVG